MKGLWILKIGAGMLAIFAILTLVVMTLWNWLLPDLFSLPMITFWQTAGLLLLVKLIFGFGKLGRHHLHRGHHKKHWMNKWHNLSDDQKENLKQKFAEKWCGHINDPAITDEKLTRKS